MASKPQEAKAAGKANLPPSGRGKTPKPAPKLGPCTICGKDHRSFECPDRFSASRRTPSSSKHGREHGGARATRRTPSARARSQDKSGPKPLAASRADIKGDPPASGAPESLGDGAAAAENSKKNGSSDPGGLPVAPPPVEESPGISSATRWAVERVLSARMADLACAQTRNCNDAPQDTSVASTKADPDLGTRQCGNPGNMEAEAKTWETIESFCLQLQPMPSEPLRAEVSKAADAERLLGEHPALAEEQVADVEKPLEEHPALAEEQVADAEMPLEDHLAMAEEQVADVEKPLGEHPALAEEQVADAEMPLEHHVAMAEEQVADVEKPFEENPALSEEQVADAEMPLEDHLAMAEEQVADVEKPLEEHPALAEELQPLGVVEHPDILPSRTQLAMLQDSSPEEMSESFATSAIEQDLEAERPELQVTPARAELTAELASACARLCLEEERHRPSPRTTTSSSSILGRFELTSSIEPLLMICQEVPGPSEVHAATRGSVDSAAEADSVSEPSHLHGALSLGIEPTAVEEFCEAESGDGSSEIIEPEPCKSTPDIGTAAETETTRVSLDSLCMAKLCQNVANVHTITLKDSPAVFAGAILCAAILALPELAWRLGPIPETFV